MLYSLILELIDKYSFLNVFKYLTVRTGLAVFTSLLIVFIIGSPFINFFSSKQILNPIREDGPDEHIIKRKSQIIDLIKNNLNNNDYLMIKGSNSTGLNSLTNQIKIGKINAL